ncbi:hypothetical protein Slala05_53030 [Streptomyces lavendulae subsp. lavendulae]|nr:hypothetical protein Slala05_53030 [Streptomyces lavendulae subsp. lavendulae]
MRTFVGIWTLEGTCGAALCPPLDSLAGALSLNEASVGPLAARCQQGGGQEGDWRQEGGPGLHSMTPNPSNITKTTIGEEESFSFRVVPPGPRGAA